MEFWLSITTLLLLIPIMAQAARVDRRCPSNMTMSQDGDGWSACGFPNIVTNQRGCGRNRNNTWTYRLCDPDYLLNFYDGWSVEEAIRDAEITSPFTCFDTRDDAVNYTFAFAVLNSIRVPDLSSPDLCMNDCGLILPELKGRDPTEEEVDTALETLTSAVMDQWNLGICGNDVITIYTKKYQKAMTVTGTKASSSLTVSKVRSINAGSVDYYFKQDKIKSGLNYLVSTYKQVLLGFSPAYVLLVITGGLLIFTCCLLYYVFNIGRVITVLYDESIPTMVLKLLLYIVSFIWFVKGWMIFLSWVFDRPKARVPYIMAPMFICLIGVFFAWLSSPPINSGQSS